MKKTFFIVSNFLLFFILPLTIEGKGYVKQESQKYTKHSIAEEVNQIKIDSIVFDFFKKALITESDLAFVNYKSERLKEPFNDFWKLSKIRALKTRQSYRFINEEDKDMFITIDIFKFRNREVASQLIDIYCNIDPEFGEINKKIKGSKSISNEPIPFRTFCIEDYIFVIDCASQALPITENIFGTFVGINNELPIDALDFVPAQRHYIEDDIIRTIEPSVLPWLNYYGLKIEDFVGHKFVSEGETEIVKLSDMTMEQGAPFYMEYNKKEWDIYDPRLYDYSPNKKYFLNFLPSAGAYQDKDNKYYYFGSNENQPIYLVNKEKEKIVLLKWQESAKYADASFWVDDETCLIVGRSDQDDKTYFIECFGKLEGYYEYRTTEKRPKETYLIENLKSRGIRIEK